MSLVLGKQEGTRACVLFRIIRGSAQRDGWAVLNRYKKDDMTQSDHRLTPVNRPPAGAEPLAGIRKHNRGLRKIHTPSGFDRLEGIHHCKVKYVSHQF